MSLNKAILHGKEHRKPYRNSKDLIRLAEITVLVLIAGITDCITDTKLKIKEAEE